MKLSWSRVKRELEKIYEGGGKKAIQKQKEKNKLTARERIKYLCDADKPFIEIGTFAGFEMYPEYGGCPAGGTVSGLGYVSGRQCVIVANDQTVKAGAWFPITGKKNLRMQEIAMENMLPVIYIVDSAGVFLPMQDEIFPDKENFGRIFRLLKTRQRLAGAFAAFVGHHVKAASRFEPLELGIAGSPSHGQQDSTRGCKSHRGGRRRDGTACRACFQTCGVRNCRTNSIRDCGCCNLRSFLAAFIAVLP